MHECTFGFSDSQSFFSSQKPSKELFQIESQTVKSIILNEEYKKAEIEISILAGGKTLRGKKKISFPSINEIAEEEQQILLLSDGMQHMEISFVQKKIEEMIVFVLDHVTFIHNKTE